MFKLDMFFAVNSKISLCIPILSGLLIQSRSPPKHSIGKELVKGARSNTHHTQTYAYGRIERNDEERCERIWRALFSAWRALASMAVHLLHFSSYEPPSSTFPPSNHSAKEPHFGFTLCKLYDVRKYACEPRDLSRSILLCFSRSLAYLASTPLTSLCPSNEQSFVNMCIRVV